MTQFCKSFSVSSLTRNESGNAMIYVLIVVVLFAALTLTLSRREDATEVQQVSEEKLTLYATNIMQASMQLKTSIDQMVYSGTDIDELDFVEPADAGYTAGSHIHKVFHPEGGGVILPRIPDEAITQVNLDPAPGWYLGRFNNVEWTYSSSSDVMLTAHQISKALCEKINKRITNSTAIPALTGGINTYLIDASEHTGGQADLTSVVCANCDGWPQLCVTDNTSSMYSYYSIIEAQ